MDRIDFAALTDVGRKREHNEDNFLVDKKLSLFVVCDGMGGHAAGEVASALAVRTVHDELKKEKTLLDDYATGKKGGDLVTKRDILNALEFAVNRASSKIHSEATKDERKRGMGTTIVGILFAANQAFIVHVGDSRVYLLRDSVLEQVTEDHNVYNELLKRKKMTREQIEKLAPKNAITRAVGVYEHCEPESLVLDVTDGDRFLLCTDGLSQYFEDDTVGLAKGLGEPDANAAVKKLIDTANERGGSDNITAILITLGEAGVRDVDRAKKLQLKREILARMPLFRPLNDREILRVLQVTDVVPYQNGEVVITEGEKGDELFIVLEGTVDVIRGDSKLTSLSPGEHFGEMALIRAQPRSATVKSSGLSELMVIRRSDFFEILRNEHQLAVKLLWQFLGVLADRLADTSRELGEAREELAAEDITQEIFFSEEDEDRQTSRLPPPPPPPPSLRTPPRS
ncbi:MAG TPA: Stp1/IreP family PP2C-type Ser/Thr phosphatase [Polyangiaceae bacterium]|jgi:serine/threonine protein phosphatase PrpC/CRP-like cAMP-binding protein|nr:Stp1/IreP family PP2C-type Ser/Thr phosphatase [Polyangiaceae bacterium]